MPGFAVCPNCPHLGQTRKDGEWTLGARASCRVQVVAFLGGFFPFAWHGEGGIRKGCWLLLYIGELIFWTDKKCDLPVRSPLLPKVRMLVLDRLGWVGLGWARRRLYRVR